MSAQDGSKGLIAEVISDAAAQIAQQQAAAAGEQIPLFTPPIAPQLTLEPDGKGGQRIVAAQSLTPAEIAMDGEARRRAGRPRGATSRSTRQLREWLLRGGVLPQKWMMDFALMDPEALAARANASLTWALEFQAKLMNDLAPYLMPKMASVDDDGRAVPMMGMLVNNAIVMPGEALPAGVRPPWETRQPPPALNHQPAPASGQGGQP